MVQMLDFASRTVNDSSWSNASAAAFRGKVASRSDGGIIPNVLRLLSFERYTA